MNDQNTFEHQKVAWTPTEEFIEKAQLTRFMRQTGAENFEEVYQKSIENVEEFTSEVLKFLDIKFDPPYENYSIPAAASNGRNGASAAV